MTPRALLSVTDKTGLAAFAEGLVALGYELLSTGGTARALRDAGLTVTDVAEVTGFPEMLDGRVKTLHPMVHGGLLGDLREPSHVASMAEAGIRPISVVAVNLYAFEATVSGEHSRDEAVESIDIGGPAMVRSSAKNHASVTVVVDPADYPSVLAALREGGSVEGRLNLAAKAFRHTAYYDSVIARYLTEAAGEEPFTETLTVGYRREEPFRYGENPHQRGARYRDPLGPTGLVRGERVAGLELGYNNWNDADGAWELVADLEGVACAITKHGNPCGAAVAATFSEAFRIARDADPVSAFGGVVAFNGVVDLATAEALCEKGNKLDVVCATGFSEEALALFREGTGWRPQARLVRAELPRPQVVPLIRGLRGGALAQDSDEDPGHKWRVVTALKPTDDQMRALRFLWRVIPHVKSNAIVVGGPDRLLGVGAGQMNRVQSVRLAVEGAGDHVRGACLASDAFLPFPDSVEAAAAAGIAAIVQPGGSVKDEDSIRRADELGVAMCFTGARHFRH